ncbi:hypothetical protein BDN70DRAFT_996866 [Pholiota conissans]|uniref:Uncharacterized protein n=1 Tax=Pholiota conissans TaxID=109636 RepID=A0A9P6CVF3_9AGAR|nr:hypothetical protein BDN70DRAFT_996866 [Pholiota conissans]
MASLSVTALRTIFENICANYPSVRVPFERSDPRHVLSLVCLEWRTIIFCDMPSLWANIGFTGGPDPQFNQEPQSLLRQFALCVDRSAQRPLSIFLEMIYDGWQFSIVDSVVIPQIRRIKSLTTPIYSDAEIFKFLTIPQGEFLILESLELCLINTLERPASSFAPLQSLHFSTLRSIPLLRRAMIYILNGMRPNELNLPLSQLVSISLAGATILPSELIHILRSASQLEQAFFYIGFTMPSHRHEALAIGAVEMRKLRTLRLRLLFPNRDKRLFSLLRFPVLRHLWIDIYGDFQHWHIPIYTRLIKASTNSLRELRLTDFNYHNPGELDDDVDEVGLERRYSEIPPHSIEALFEVIRNVESLFLPVGILLHASTLNKIASCALLPYLEEIEVGALSAWPILSMIRYRRTRAVMSASLGASHASDVLLPAPDDKPLAEFKYIYILIPFQGLTVAEEDALAEEMEDLESLGIVCRILATPILPLPSMPAVSPLPPISN